MSKIFITGATGFIGRRLVAALVQRGDQVVALSRKAGPARAQLGTTSVEVVEGDPQYAGSWQEKLAGCDAVVHLAGESVGARRWDTRQRQILRDSRVDGTRRLVEAIGSAPGDRRPRVLISASGIDFYPLDVDVRGLDDDDDVVDEKTGPGDHFLARLCADWEVEAKEAEKHGLRVVRMRTGLVVGGSGGAMDKWAAAFRKYVGGKLGSGRQWVSWIHLDDVLRAYLFALDHASLSGPVNLVAPRRLRNAEFARQMGESMGKPSWLPVPGPALRIAVGGLAEYLLHGRPAVPGALQAAGFTFTHQLPFEAGPPPG